MDVEYREITGFPGYRVGNDGSVWSKLVRGGRVARLGDSWVILKPVAHVRTGHLLARLFPGPRQVKVHRLVLEAFVGPCPPGMQCCHDPDHSPTNNALSNLRWGTHQENRDDMVRQERSTSGENHWNYKVTDEMAKSMKSLRESGKTYKEVADAHGVCESTAWLIINHAKNKRVR